MFGRPPACIACQKQVKKSGGYIHYDIRSLDDSGSYEVVGRMDTHRDPGCFAQSSAILRDQFEKSIDPEDVCVTTYLNGEEIVFYMAYVDGSFVFRNIYKNWRGKIKPVSGMRELFMRCMDRKDLVFGMFHRPSGKTGFHVMKLLLAKGDPTLAPDLLQSEQYRTRVRDAKEQFDMGMQVRGHDEGEAMSVLTRYIVDTMVEIR